MKSDVSVLSVLEAGQVTGNQKPLARKKLGRGAMAVLVLLRVYAIIAIPIVGYAFVRALLAS